MERLRNAYSNAVSPVGWYLGSYLLRFIELEAPGNDDPDGTFQSWENTVLVKAATIEAAFTKLERIGRRHAKPYRGGVDGHLVAWQYLGVTEVVPIYEEIADGAELAWRQRRRTKLSSLRNRVVSIGALRSG